MSIEEVRRLTEELNQTQVALEQECRETFLPGMKVAYPFGRREIIVEIVGEDEDEDYRCWVKNPKSRHEYRINYTAICRIVDGDI